MIVRAKSYSRVYGDENPVFELDLGGSSLEGVPELLCTANATSQVGTYTIEVRQGTIKNEDVLLENGTLTITKAPLTISVGNYTKKQGDAMPTLSDKPSMPGVYISSRQKGYCTINKRLHSQLKCSLLFLFD